MISGAPAALGPALRWAHFFTATDTGIGNRRGEVGSEWIAQQKKWIEEHSGDSQGHLNHYD